MRHRSPTHCTSSHSPSASRPSGSRSSCSETRSADPLRGSSTCTECFRRPPPGCRRPCTLRPLSCWRSRQRVVVRPQRSSRARARRTQRPPRKRKATGDEAACADCPLERPRRSSSRHPCYVLGVKQPRPWMLYIGGLLLLTLLISVCASGRLRRIVEGTRQELLGGQASSSASLNPRSLKLAGRVTTKPIATTPDSRPRVPPTSSSVFQDSAPLLTCPENVPTKSEARSVTRSFAPCAQRVERRRRAQSARQRQRSSTAASPDRDDAGCRGSRRCILAQEKPLCPLAIALLDSIEKEA